MRGLTADSLAGGLTLSSLLRLARLAEILSLDSRLRWLAKVSRSRCTMALRESVCFRREANTHRSSGFCRACAVRAGPGGGESERLAREGESG